MKNFILVYYIDDYPENGGGIKYEEFETSGELDKRVSEIYNSCDILAAGELDRYSYKVVEIVTKVERE